MSGKIMGQVWDLDLPTNEQLVLLAMADHADHIGENIYPSVGLIAWKTGYSERTIQRLIKSLLKKNILKIQKQRPGKTTIYCTAFQNAPLRQPYKSEQTPDIYVTPDTKDVTPTPDTQMSPEPSIEPSIKKTTFASPDGNAQSVLETDAALYGETVIEAEALVTPILDGMSDREYAAAVYELELMAKAQNIPTNKPKKEREPNPWYDAIAATLGVEGWKNGHIQNVLLGTGKNGYSRYNLHTPLTEPEQVHIFWAWFEKKCKGCELKSVATTQSRVMEWQREGMPDVRNEVKPKSQTDIAMERLAQGLPYVFG